MATAAPGCDHQPAHDLDPTAEQVSSGSSLPGRSRPLLKVVLYHGRSRPPRSDLLPRLFSTPGSSLPRLFSAHARW